MAAPQEEVTACIGATTPGAHTHTAVLSLSGCAGAATLEDY